MRGTPPSISANARDIHFRQRERSPLPISAGAKDISAYFRRCEGLPPPIPARARDIHFRQRKRFPLPIFARAKDISAYFRRCEGLPPPIPARARNIHFRQRERSPLPISAGAKDIFAYFHQCKLPIHSRQCEEYPLPRMRKVPFAHFRQHKGHSRLFPPIRVTDSVHHTGGQSAQFVCAFSLSCRSVRCCRALRCATSRGDGARWGHGVVKQV